MFVPGVQDPGREDDEDLVFVFRGDTVLVLAADERAEIPSRAALRTAGVALQATHFLGSLDGRHCYAAPLAAPGLAATSDPGADAPPGMEWLGLRAVFTRIDDLAFALAGRAYQILQWDRTHRYCGRCGTTTEFHASDRARVCPACKLTAYPRLSPAVMVLVTRGRELLLARSPHFAEGMFSALAGFVEAGETLEQTAEREVFEEVGVRIANLRYFGSQSWPFPNSLMIAFVADYVSGEITPQPGEIEAAGWFPREALPRLPHPVSIARRLIDAAVAELPPAL